MERWNKVVNTMKEDSTVNFFAEEFQTLEEKIAFFEERGLHVERVPFYTEDTQLNILYGFDADGQTRMKQLMQSFYIWKMTANNETVEENVQVANGFDPLQTENELSLLLAKKAIESIVYQAEPENTLYNRVSAEIR